MQRPIIEINEDLCTGCGQCIVACAEGALELVDGKAKLVSDSYCDGLGDCLGQCPEGALTVVERDAEAFDEAAVADHMGKPCPHGNPEVQVSQPGIPIVSGCPSAHATAMETKGSPGESYGASEIGSELCHWPVKLQLLPPSAGFLQGSDLLLLADCVAVALPDAHRTLLRGHTVATGCPKLDNLQAHIDKLTEIIRTAQPRSLTVAFMEVPCCHGFVFAAEKAIEQAGAATPLYGVKISRNGQCLQRRRIMAENATQA
ncbi:MAG: ATP-binding protein [Planctomycetota bacterium]